MIILLTTIYTFYATGISNSHYHLQVYPFIFILVVGILIKKEITLNISLLTILVVLICSRNISQYYHVTKHVQQTSTLFSGSTFRIIEELRKNNLQNQKIFFAYYHLGYWLLNQYPLTKSTNPPTTLKRPYVFKYFDNPRHTSLEEIRYIMEEIKPCVVVSRVPFLSFFPENSIENMYFKNIIAQKFQAVYEKTEEKIFIWNGLMSEN